MWSQEEDEALCWHADHLWKTRMLKKELLLLHFPGHLQEAIKKRLQTIKWVPPSDPMPIYHPLPEVGTETVPVPRPDLPAQSSASTSASGSHPATTWMTTLLEVAALNLREDKMGTHELIIPKHTGKLDSLLQELMQAPLKLQQQMLLLRTFLSHQQAPPAQEFRKREDLAVLTILTFHCDRAAVEQLGGCTAWGCVCVTVAVCSIWEWHGEHKGIDCRI
ncbi:hypothetical protein E2320_022541, partial [Naja naja]